MFVFGGKNIRTSFIQQVEKYSIVNDAWEVVTKLSDDHSGFGVCAFMDKVYLMGGDLWREDESYESDESSDSYDSDCFVPERRISPTSSCLEFDTKNYQLKKKSCVNVARSYGPRDNSPTVFEGKVVIAGGVESYDALADEWSFMASTNKNDTDVDLVTVKNKLFAFGGFEQGRALDLQPVCCCWNSEECFLGLQSVHFVRQQAHFFRRDFVDREEVQTVDCCDAETNEWSENSFEAEKRLQSFICLKVPSLIFFS